MAEDKRLINGLKNMTDEDLVTLLQKSINLQIYLMSTTSISGADREIYIQTEITKEQNRRK